MIGAVVIAVLLVVVLPVGVLMSGSLAAGLFGWLLKERAEETGDEVWTALNN